MTMPLETALSGDAVALVEALACGPYFVGPPDECSAEYERAAIPPDWTSLLRAGKWPLQLEWHGARRRLLIEPALVTVAFGEVPRRVDAVTELLATLPFEIASFATIHPSWRAGDGAYLAPSFGDGHLPHGWACAFRGRGHDRLVSRRWLPAGPWRLHEQGDMSFVQFHDLDLDAASALAQARPGHARMGITPEGGFIYTDYVYEHDLAGHYRPAQRMLKILVSRRDVSRTEMLDACAARFEQALGPERPIDDVAFVFIEEARARRHLRELWLRGLRCHAMIKGVETRLDGPEEPPA
jgi:hypothetical protein